MRDFIVKQALKLGLYETLMNVSDYFTHIKANRLFRKYGLETLVQADKAFGSVNIQMFLNFGTLLGAYRDKGFIPFDFDLDVGVMARQRPENLDEIMQAYGFVKKKQLYIQETGRITEDQYLYKGLQIDVFYFFEDEIMSAPNCFYCYVARRHETKEWKEANRTDGFPCVLWPCEKTEFSQTDFLGHKFYVPNATKEWLSGIYGSDFMTPIKNWTVGERNTKIIHHTERLYRR